MANVLGCQRAVGGAVEPVHEWLREMAAASGWCAVLLIAKRLRAFRSLVRSVCVINEGVAVVELVRAAVGGGGLGDVLGGGDVECSPAAAGRRTACRSVTPDNRRSQLPALSRLHAEACCSSVRT